MLDNFCIWQRAVVNLLYDDRQYLMTINKTHEEEKLKNRTKRKMLRKISENFCMFKTSLKVEIFAFR